MKTCEKCKRPAKSGERFCQSHAIEMLTQMEAAGYLQPLSLRTQDGFQKLSPHRFLTVKTPPQSHSK